jgi:protein-tyrosine-phosphatase
MAEALLRTRLAERAPGLTIGSIGQLFDGRSPERGAIKAMADRGIDISDHLSRKQTPALIADSALILCMEKVHVRDLSVLAPGTFERTFTLPEFVRLVEAEPPRTDRDLRRWVQRIGADREHLGYLSSSRVDEVADPMGRSTRVFRACAAELDDLVSRMVDRVWPVSVPAAR